MEEMVQGSFEQVAELLSTWGLQVIGAVAVLIIGRWAAGFIRKSVRRGMERAGTDVSLVPFVSSLVYYLALTVVVIEGLSFKLGGSYEYDSQNEGSNNDRKYYGNLVYDF